MSLLDESLARSLELVKRKAIAEELRGLAGEYKVPVEAIMSLLDESLARSLELVKREAETPLEQSLRAEVARLTERLSALNAAYDTKSRDIDKLYEQIRYQQVGDRATRSPRLPRQAVTIRDLAVEGTHGHYGAFDDRRLITARLMIDDMALRGFSEEDLRHEIAGMLAAQLANHLYSSHIVAPERPERAQDPSSEHKVTQSSGTPLPGYPDTRPPLIGPLKRDHIASPNYITRSR